MCFTCENIAYKHRTTPYNVYKFKAKHDENRAYLRRFTFHYYHFYTHSNDFENLLTAMTMSEGRE